VGLMLRLYAAIGVFGVAGVAVVVDQFDKKMNYYQMEVAVAEIERTCHLEKSTRGLVSKTREWTNDADCDLVYEAQANDPEYKDFDVEGSATVTVSYTSPVDQSYTTGKIYLNQSDENFRTLKVNDRIVVLAHEDDPKKIRKL
jgi:hypothetical protein